MIGSDGSGCDIFCGQSGGGSSAFTDTSNATFSLGTFTDTQWNFANTWLDLTPTGLVNKTGSFTSRIFDMGSVTSPSTISWIPQQPYGKELPDTAQTETAYPSGNVSMNGNVLLLHMNETTGTSVFDSSGQGNHGVLYDPTKYIIGQNGKINKSVHFTNSFQSANGQIRIPHSSSLNLGNAGSVCVWVNLDDYTQNNAGFVHKGDASGFTNSEYSLQVYLTGRTPTFNVADTTGSDRYIQSNIDLTSGTWNHVCGTYNTSDAINIYVNGQKTGSLLWNPTWIPRHGTGSLQVGAQLTVNNEYPMKGYLDEVAIFNRELSISEIVTLYQRAALNLKFQIRSCNDSLCSSNSFIGPDGTNGTYYDESINTTTTLPTFPITNLSSNQYVQYQASLTTDTSSYSPALKNISIQYLTIGEMTAPTCVDLSVPLSKYLKTIPMDPSVGTNEKTHYAIRSIATGGVQIVSCSPENNESITVSR